MWALLSNGDTKGGQTLDPRLELRKENEKKREGVWSSWGGTKGRN